MEGLGRNAAEDLIADGHELVLHARNDRRADTLDDLAAKGAHVVVGDLARLDEARTVADGVNRLGRMDAVIHNAGVEHGASLLPVNVVAPYVLTALIERPARLVYISSGMHRGGRPDLTDVGWSGAPDALLLRQQAAGHGAGTLRRPHVAGGVHQRCRPGVGAHPHGRRGGE
ncbi:SDR family NAD(P)-dependent oxidoreductase [Streptomyces sp. NPDC048385]|uniref:SDR family NAD(P)-dependent oxidoreductase n=1 Tax=Streptomyces sp. NPDC048385 TaxID=3155145 RepID=UPI00341EACBF